MANGGDFLLGLLGGVGEGGKGAVDFLAQQRQFQAEQQFRQQQLVQQAALAREEMALKKELETHEAEQEKRKLLLERIERYTKRGRVPKERAIREFEKEAAMLDFVYGAGTSDEVRATIDKVYIGKEEKAKKELAPVPAGLTTGEARVARGTQALGEILPTARPTPQVGAQAAQFPFGLPSLAGGVTQPAARVGRTVGRGIQAGVTGQTPPEPQFQMPKGLENMAVNVKGTMSDVVNTLMQLIGRPIPKR
jgi:hypothetical protein